ncbi:hypothetical protein NESM_000464200 [Novymonas esmeraldas]|uniref:BAR domain-containing protein n=1 Tax=Novymonas esmeraldas TaxID=1808958 RepID=A0AAW0ENT4_9TRYP
MEALKGIARRTTQSFRELISRNEVTPEEMRLSEVMSTVWTVEAKGELICAKVIQAARLMGELGATLREIGEEYKCVPDLPQESRDLADDVFEVGVKLVETSQEHQKGLRDNGFEVLRTFSKQCAQLREVEATRRDHQLEYDFFKAKVQVLRNAPQKDITRLPRNEQILENWRVELWRATERSKAMCSQLYVDGRRAIDRSVLTTVQVLHSFVEIASAGFEQTFKEVRLPAYPTAPVLPPTALPAAPVPSHRPSLALGYDAAARPTPYAYGVGAASGPGGGVVGASNSGVPGTMPTPGTTYASAPPGWSATYSASPAVPQPVPPGADASASPGGSLSYADTHAAPEWGHTDGYRPPALTTTRDSLGNGSNPYQPPNVP